MKVYLVEMNTGSEKQYKIGRTKKKVKDRIKELEVANPYPIKEVFEYNSPFAVKLETTLHRYYGRTNTRGEWFYLNEMQIESFIEVCKNIENNLKVLNENYNPYI